MALEQTFNQSSGTNATFTITAFDFIDTIDVKVSVTPSGGSTDLKTEGVHYNINNNVDKVLTFTTGNLPPVNAVVKAYRDTLLTSAKHTYQSGSAITAKDLNRNQKQMLHSLEEWSDNVATSHDHSSLAHNHDSSYSSLAHNHDSSYINLTGGTFTGDVTFTSNLVSGSSNDLTLQTGNTSNKIKLGNSLNSDVLSVDSAGVTVDGTITETIYSETFDAASETIDPVNGTIQRITLSQAGHTIGFTNRTAGWSVLLMIDDGDSTPTGTVTTWTGVTWVGGFAPSLTTAGYSIIEVWKAQNNSGVDTIFACYLGDVTYP